MAIFVMVVLTNHYSKLLSNLESFVDGSDYLKIESKTTRFSFEQKPVIVADQLKHLNAIIAHRKLSVI